VEWAEYDAGDADEGLEVGEGLGGEVGVETGMVKYGRA
jgi:hypothetical protein